MDWNDTASRRLVILGNCGSGRSTLARRIADATGRPVFDLDAVHWTADGRKADEAEARQAVRSLAEGAAWIVEGVYGWLAEPALSRATALAWLDLPWPECRSNLLRRGPQHGEADQADLLAWAAAYGTRTTSSSRQGHQRLFDGFGGSRVRLGTGREVDAVAALSR